MSAPRGTTTTTGTGTVRDSDGRLGRGGAGEQGAGTVLALAVVAATVLAAGTALPLAGLSVLRQRAVAAADAAALAAADVALGVAPGYPCPTAQALAQAHGTALDACLLEGAVATVRVSVHAHGVTLTSTATAGPPP